MVVQEMLEWDAPPCLILLVLLVRWCNLIPSSVDARIAIKFYPSCPYIQSINGSRGFAVQSDEDRNFLEVFSGKGEVTKAFRDAPWMQKRCVLFGSGFCHASVSL